MTNEEMLIAWKNYYRVKVANLDYSFSGLITTIYQKRFRPVQGEHSVRQTRCVVESDDRIEKILAAKDLVLDDETVRKLKIMEDIRSRPHDHPELYKGDMAKRRIR